MRIGIIGCILAVTVFTLLFSCRKARTPRPRGYFRIELPEKEYQRFVSEDDFSFDYPVYGVIDTVSKNPDNNYIHYNIRFPDYKSTVYLTYFRGQNKDNILSKIENLRNNYVYKHIVKADDITETPFEKTENQVYGIIYDIKGNAASNLNFYITDDSSRYLSGALYFRARPNKDSLAPVVSFFREDIIHLLESLHWE